jgi:hypothetical protein
MEYPARMLAVYRLSFKPQQGPLIPIKLWFCEQQYLLTQPLLRGFITRQYCFIQPITTICEVIMRRAFIATLLTALAGFGGWEMWALRTGSNPSVNPTPPPKTNPASNAADTSPPSAASAPANLPMAGTPQPASDKQYLSYKDSRLSARLQGQPLPKVAQYLLEQAGVQIRIPDSLRGAQVSAQFLGQPLETGMRALFRDFDAFYFVEGGAIESDSAAHPARLVWLFPTGKGKRLAPVAAEDWASLEEAARLAQDTDPEVRMAALRSLIQRRGKDALPYVLAAMEDKNDQVRYRTLETALKSGVILPVDALERLALADGSEIVRFLAIEGAVDQYRAAQPEAVRRIAEQALADANPVLRSHALDVLGMLEPEPPRPGQARQTGPARP